MVTLEQIKLLESKIAHAISFVERVTEENIRLKKRNKELDEIIVQLQEEKNRVEEGIVSALGKLNQFEDAIERSLSSARSKPEENLEVVKQNFDKAMRNAPEAVPSADTALPSPLVPPFSAEPREYPEAPVASVSTVDIAPPPTASVYGLASAYTEDEDPEEEDSDEAVLDIF